MHSGQEVRFQQLSTIFFFFFSERLYNFSKSTQPERGLGFEPGLLVAQMVKNPPVNAGDPGSILGSGRRKWQHTPVFLAGEPMDREAGWATVRGIA